MEQENIIRWQIPGFGFIAHDAQELDRTLTRLRRNFRTPAAVLKAIRRDTGENYLSGRSASATWLEVAAITTECRYYPNGA